MWATRPARTVAVEIGSGQGASNSNRSAFNASPYSCIVSASACFQVAQKVPTANAPSTEAGNTLPVMRQLRCNQQRNHGFAAMGLHWAVLALLQPLGELSKDATAAPI